MKSNQRLSVLLCSVPQKESEPRAETKMTVSGPSLLWHTQMLWTPSWPLPRARTWLWTWGSNLSPARCPPRPTAPLCHPQLLRSHFGSLYQSTAFHLVCQFCSSLIGKLCMWAPETFICFNKLHAKEWIIKLKRYRGIFYVPKHDDFALISLIIVLVRQVKQEVEEVICIKEEPEEEEVMATLLLDCKVEQGHLPEPEVRLMENDSWFVSEMISADVRASSQINACFCLMLQAQGSATEPAGPPANLGNPIPTLSSAGPNTCE